MCSEIQISFWVINYALRIILQRIVLIPRDEDLAHLFLTEGALVIFEFHFLSQNAVPATVSMSTWTDGIVNDEFSANSALLKQF